MNLLELRLVWQVNVRDGCKVVFVRHNMNGWLTSIKDGGTNAIVTYEYDSAGRRIKRTLQNSTTLPN